MKRKQPGPDLLDLLEELDHPAIPAFVPAKPVYVIVDDPVREMCNCSLTRRATVGFVIFDKKSGWWIHGDPECRGTVTPGRRLEFERRGLPWPYAISL